METEKKNAIWTAKYKIYDRNNWKKETRTNRRRGKGRKEYKNKNQSLKKILQLSVVTLSTGLLIEASIWPARRELNTQF